MNLWAWVVMLGIIFFTLLPFIEKKKRTREEIQKAIITVGIVLGVILAVLLFDINYVVALLFGFLAMILFDRKTYTKKRLIIYVPLALALVLVGLIYALLRDNPNYVLKHLKENPQNSSFYLAENGEVAVAYESDIKRPLASTVKILIALEYAMQVEENKLQKDMLVSLDELSKFYLKNSDGGAHEAWLEAMQQSNNIQNNQVTLHDVAKGMITYSSNANTDYLINLLGVEAINTRKNQLGLLQHDDVYPVVSALYISDAVQTGDMSEEELINELEAMSFDEYSTIAQQLSRKMQTGEFDLSEETLELSSKLQKVWSDRLIGASANDYGKLLQLISNDELPTGAAQTMRDLMEWPMQLNEENKKHYLHVGSKGGSTMFVLNNAMYVEDLKGNQFEIVYLLNELNLLENFLIQKHRKSFEVKLINDIDFRKEVIQELTQ